MGFLLIALRVFFHDISNVDGFVILLYFMLYIPIVSKHLQSAKFLGSEFQFKDEIKKAKESVELSNQKTAEFSEFVKNEDKVVGSIKNISNYETFDLSIVKTIVDADHILALAGLRIEIEKKMRAAFNFIFGSSEKMPLSEIISQIGDGVLFSKEQVNALKQILAICNKAIHGFEVTLSQAKEIIELAEYLNISFPVGYSINVMPNHNYKQNGLVCEFEHCIERMPLPVDNDIKDMCPVFGHFCPGGQAYVKKCNKNRIKSE
jgi:hypothetical protein